MYISIMHRNICALHVYQFLLLKSVKDLVHEVGIWDNIFKIRSQFGKYVKSNTSFHMKNCLCYLHISGQLKVNNDWI